MTWEPSKSFLAVTPFRDNAIAFMEEHISEALEWAAAQCGLAQAPPPPEEFCRALAVRNKRPIVNVLDLGSDPEDTDDDRYDEVKRLLVEVEATAGDADQLIATLEPYTLAFKSMLTEMDEEDWWKGIDQGTRGDLSVIVGRERFGGRTYENEKTFLQVGSVEVTIAYTQA